MKDSIAYTLENAIQDRLIFDLSKNDQSSNHGVSIYVSKDAYNQCQLSHTARCSLTGNGKVKDPNDAFDYLIRLAKFAITQSKATSALFDVTRISSLDDDAALIYDNYKIDLKSSNDNLDYYLISLPTEKLNFDFNFEFDFHTEAS